MADSIIEPVSRVETKKDLKRQRILDAAKRRFGRSGIRATTMQDIAQEAGVAVGTIYQFFPDKDALILAWVDEHRRLIRIHWEQVLALPITADQKLREFLKVRFHTVRTMREEPAVNEIARVVMRLAPETITAMSQTALGYLRSIIEEGHEAGLLPSAVPEVDAEILFHSMTGFFPAHDDPIHPRPTEETMLRVVDWFIAKWKLPPSPPQS